MPDQYAIKSRRNQTITLKDGRKLGFSEYGDKRGFPIIGFHGTPGSRLWFPEDDDVSTSLGIRLITIDRPGYGSSDPKKNRKITEFNADVIELIEYLNLDTFSVFGVSGGGVYAAAFGSSKHPNLYKIGLVSTINEFKHAKPPKGMCRPNRMAFFLARRVPWLLRYSYKQQKYLLDNKPETYIKSSQSHVNHLSESDQEVLKRPETMESMMLQMQEAFRKNANEVVYELKLIANKWDFNCSSIRCPVEIWHGVEDTLSPVGGVKELEKIIPNCHMRLMEKKGHFLDEDVEIWKDILLSLRKNV